MKRLFASALLIAAATFISSDALIEGCTTEPGTEEAVSWNVGSTISFCEDEPDETELADPPTEVAGAF